MYVVQWKTYVVMSLQGHRTVLAQLLKNSRLLWTEPVWQILRQCP